MIRGNNILPLANLYLKPSRLTFSYPTSKTPLLLTMSNDDGGCRAIYDRTFALHVILHRKIITFCRDTGTSQRQSPPTNSASGSSGNLSIWMRYRPSEIPPTTAYHRHACPPRRRSTRSPVPGGWANCARGSQEVRECDS